MLWGYNGDGIKFITVRRRGKTIVEHINGIEDSRWKKIDVERDNGKGRTVTCCEVNDVIRDYDGTIRQVFNKDNGKTKPAILMANDFNIPLKDLMRKYSRRWLVETEISEHIDFFHLNRNSSGIVIKVDFDLTMTILAHNLYRLFCMNSDGCSHCEAQTVFNKFISTPGSIWVDEKQITVRLK